MNKAELLEYVRKGGQITTGMRWIMPVGDRFFMCCDNEGCCDMYFDLDEFDDVVEGDDWSVVDEQR
jgi:hypothetical protein